MEGIITHRFLVDDQFLFRVYGGTVYDGIQVHLIVVDNNYNHLISDSALLFLRPH